MEIYYCTLHQVVYHFCDLLHYSFFSDAKEPE